MLYGNFEPLFLGWQIALQVTSSIDFKSQWQTTDFEDGKWPFNSRL